MACLRRVCRSIKRTGGPDDHAGFTVIEFVIAIALFVTVIVPVTQVLISSARVSANLRSRVTASYLAAQTLEQVRSSASTDGSTFWQSVNPGVTPVTTTTSYTITQDIEWILQGTQTSQCSAASGGTTGDELLQVTATITWANMGGTAPVTSIADLAPPAGSFSNTTGAAGVSVVNAAGQLNPGATITLTGGTGPVDPIVTGADGCAFFAFIPTGTYTASATAPTQVSNQEATTATSASFSVVAGKTIEVPALQLDVGGTILVTSSIGPPAAATVGGLSLPYAAHYSSLTPPSQPYPAGTTSLAPLFPFPGGYVPFAGTCTDSDPLGQNTSLAVFYTAAAAPWALTAPWAAAIQPVVVVPPGTTPSATNVALYPLGLAITNANNRVITAVTATPTTATGTAPPTWKSTINWACPTTPVYRLVPPPTGTSVASTTAIGLGHYTVQVTTSAPVTTTTVYVWVEPDGTHLITGSGSVGTVGPPVTQAAVTLP